MISFRLFPIVVLTLLLTSCQVSSTLSNPATTYIPASSSTESSSLQTETVQSSSEMIQEPEKIEIVPQDIIIETGNINIRIDPLMEMLSVIQYLSDYDQEFHLLTRYETAYRDDVEQFFSNYKTHDAVKYINEMMKRGFSYDKPPEACLYIDKSFQVKENYPDSELATYLTIDVEEFCKIMEQFFIDTQFDTFFVAHEDFYKQITTAYADEFPQWDMIKTMESYYGKTFSGYNIILVTLFHGGGFGSSIEDTDGYHLYSIFGPSSTDGSIPVFGDTQQVTGLVLHEFGHSFIPIGGFFNETMSNEVERSSYLLEPIKQKMSDLAYNGWHTVYEESVLRAAVIDIMVKNTQASPEPLLQNERSRNFVYIDDIYKIIQDYSTQRDQYPVFDTFIPVITDYLIEQYPQS